MLSVGGKKASKDYNSSNIVSRSLRIFMSAVITGGTRDMNSKTLEKKSSWIDASLVTRILICLTFVAVLVYACVMKLKELRLSFFKLADS
jgi:hypothetical protein